MEFETWIATGRFFACAAMDRLLEQLEVGDPRAAQLLRAMNVPPEIVRAMRDDEIRVLAGDLRAVVPGISDNRVASILEAFGDAGRQSVRCDVAPELTENEFSEFSGKVSNILKWAPVTKRGNSWPKKRQLADILKR